MCTCVHVLSFVCACVRAYVCACLHVCVRLYVRVCACVSACVYTERELDREAQTRTKQSAREFVRVAQGRGQKRKRGGGDKMKAAQGAKERAVSRGLAHAAGEFSARALTAEGVGPSCLSA